MKLLPISYFFKILPSAENHISISSNYHLSDILFDLLKFAAEYLVLGGRLVYWLPVYKPEYVYIQIHWMSLICYMVTSADFKDGHGLGEPWGRLILKWAPSLGLISIRGMVAGDMRESQRLFLWLLPYGGIPFQERWACLAPCYLSTGRLRPSYSDSPLKTRSRWYWPLNWYQGNCYLNAGFRYILFLFWLLFLTSLFSLHRFL